MKGKAKNYMIRNADLHRDDCGEINLTTLAEETCYALDLYEGTDCPEWVFELAFEVGEALE